MNQSTGNSMKTSGGESFFSRLNLKALTPYSFLLPFLVIFSVFGIFPLLFSVFLSFHS
ncbi:sugar ABC transporter permease, partial [Vibrio sinaloensis]